MSRVLVSLVVILLSAKLGGALVERFRQPAVLGELIFGVILGNLSLLGFHGLDYLKSNEVITILAEIGVIFLLFEVGLESNIKEMLEVGVSSFLVALVGVIRADVARLGRGRLVSTTSRPRWCTSLSGPRSVPPALALRPAC